MKLIHVVADPLAQPLSVNKRVAARFVGRLQAEIAELRVEEVDLERDPPPYYDRDLFRFVWNPVADPQYRPSPDEKAAARYMQRHAEMLRGADLLLLSAPFWNYFVPAVLKAWIDQVLSPGEMFTLGAEGRLPLHRIRAMVSIVSAGGWISPQGHDQSLLQLLQAAFEYAGIERQHGLLIEAQEPALFADHAEREAQGCADAERLAAEIARDLGGAA